MTKNKKLSIPLERIVSFILLVRGQKVLLDADLATLYGVTTKRLNEQVRRNRERFPEDFVFPLAPDEYEALRSQIATLKPGRGQHRKYLPYVFTEHGAIMAAAVLNTPRAVEMSLYVVRTFVQLREMLASNKELTRKLNELERKLGAHDQAIANILSAIRELMSPPEPPKKRMIGFIQDDQ
ncbi:MAG: ORF6N domain-containing protein [Sulfuricaulis sp.]